VLGQERPRQTFLRQIALLGQAPPRPVIVRTQLAPPAIALGLGDKRTGLPLRLDHVVDELDRDAEMRGCGAMRVALFHEGDDPFAKFYRMWFAHL